VRHWTDRLPANACSEGRAWARTQPSMRVAWATCLRGDWMLWLAGSLAGGPWSDSRRPLVLAACGCARLALPYVRAGEYRPRLAIETAEAWARGDAGATPQMVRDAYAAAVAAVADADAVAAAHAAYAAADAAAAAHAADAAYAYADADAAAHAAAAAQGARVLAECADIVRQHYPRAPRRARKGETR